MSNIVWHNHKVSQAEREKIKNHKGLIVWITGLSGSGKSTIANILEQKLNKAGIHTYLLDGDNIRHGLNSDLGFDEKDRAENIRRIGEVAQLFLDAGIVVITAFISPFKKEREEVRKKSNNRFFEVYLSTPLEVCEQRDPKGLYKKARKGEIPDFTGIGQKYEPPEHPELTIDTSLTNPEECAQMLFEKVMERIKNG